MAESLKIAVTTINYNSKENLRKLLKKIFNQRLSRSSLRENKASLPVENLEVWMIDNDSPDKGGVELKKQFPKLNFIESKDNVGFAKGHNLALKKIHADYILIINPDVEIPDGAIADMVEFMEKNPDCGVSSSKLIYADGTVQSNGGDLPLGMPLLVWLFNLEMIPGLEKALGNFHRTDLGYYKSPHQVGWVGGTFMFLRREILEKVGFLPEEYFMYFEDTDFCYQVQKKGYKVMINPEVTIKHFGGASSNDPKFAQFKGEAVGLEIFYQKYFNKLEVMMIKLLLLISVAFRIIAFAIAGKPAVAKIYWRVLPYV